MSASGKFFNYPLIVLAYGTSPRERLETLVMWAIIDVGRISLKHWQNRINTPAPAQVVQYFRRSAKLRQNEASDPVWQAYARLDKLAETYGIDGTDIDGYIWALGVETLGLDAAWRDAKSCLAAHGRLASFIERMPQQTGRTDKELSWVRGMKAEWVLAALRHETQRQGEQLSYAHWAVLSAVLSKIGTNKPPCKTVTWPEIQRRALGYVTNEEMQLALPFRQDAAKPLSRDMIDRRTQQLAVRGFFVRHVPKIGGKSLPAWYGSGIDQAMLVKIAEASKIKRTGGWKARWRQQQSEQTALVQKVIAFEQAAQGAPSPAAEAFKALRLRAV